MDPRDEIKKRLELLDIILGGFDPYNYETIKIDTKINDKIREYRKFDDSE